MGQKKIFMSSPAHAIANDTPAQPRAFNNLLYFTFPKGPRCSAAARANGHGRSRGDSGSESGEPGLREAASPAEALRPAAAGQARRPPGRGSAQRFE